MLLPRDKLGEAYDLIKDDASRGGCSVLILVAPEPDALASLRLITYLLRVDNIPFTAKAVSNYEDVKKCREQLDGGEIRSVVMINCGAVVDVRVVLGLSFDQDIKCFIIDSHRPIHLSNFHAPAETVLVFDDGTLNTEEVPSDGEWLSDDSNSEDESDGEVEEEEDDEEEEDEFDAEFEENDISGDAENGEDGEEEIEDNGNDQHEDNTGDENIDDEEMINENDNQEKEEAIGQDSDGSGDEERLLRKRKASEVDDVVEGTEDEEEDKKERDDNEEDDDEDDDTGSTEMSQGSNARTEAELRRQRRRRIRAYYEDACHALPSSFVLFDLCCALSRSENDQVWLACLGITDFYIHHKMTEETYEHLHGYMCDHIQKLNKAKQQTLTGDGTQIPIAETGTITANDELKFTHFRHWSLYDSMYFSPYVSSRLSVWKTNGKAKLHELFAKLGVSLEQSRQKWCFLSQQSQNSVLDQINQYSSDFDLPDLNSKAFQRCVGFSAKASASDVVHATSALLEAPRLLAHTQHSQKKVINLSREEKKGDEVEEEEVEEEEEESNSWVESFWAAYDALSVKDPHILQKGIDLSMRQQREMVSRAVAIIEKRSLVTLKHFRYAYLPKSSGLGISDDLFTNPMALSNLAQFLVEIHRQNGKWLGSKSRPLLLLAERKQTFLIVGVTAPDRAGSGTNKFGKAFKHALEHCNAAAQVTHSFESSVLEVRREDVHRFLEALHYIMN